MALADFLPFRGSQSRSLLENLDPEERKQINSVMRIASLALGQNNSLTSFHTPNRRVFEEPEHDLARIYNAIDTDSYAKRAFGKYNELFWKEGWEIVSENSDAVDYLWQRIDYLEIAMNRPFQEFLIEAIDQLVRFSNVFIVKSRGDIAPFFPGKLRTANDKNPIAGYYVLPTETIEIKRDRHNKPLFYRQNTTLSDHPHSAVRMPVWRAEDVIHIHIDKKPGRAFGTPFVTASLEDIIALRQIEEDVQNLIHRELFPLYKYRIGSDERPASKDEIDQAEIELESLRTEGGLIMPHRHDIEVVGGQENVLDVDPFLSHFKQRVAIGLGVFPHHLGMTMDGGNRSLTDRLDASLYDSIKHMQGLAADSIRFHIFNDLLWEGDYDPYVSPHRSDLSDRCEFEFNEIDIDTKVKKETHTIQKFTSNLITDEEARLEMKMKPELDESKTLAALQARMMPDITASGSGDNSGPTMIDPTPTSAKRTPSTGGVPNTPNKNKGPNNIIRPTNQFGKRNSPAIRRSDDELGIMEELISLLDDNSPEELS
jgi:hypothetical protein